MSEKKILIVDDDNNIRTLLSVNLIAQGYPIETAINGSEAITKINSDPPWLIILDVMMPQIDGWEVCKFIRDDPEFESIKIIFLTARDTERDRLIGKNVLKADVYLTKPFDMDILLSTIRSLQAA